MTMAQFFGEVQLATDLEAMHGAWYDVGGLGEPLVKRIVGDQALPDDIVDDIVKRTDGVPLFIEELTKSVLENGPRAEDPRISVATAPSSAMGVPAALRGPLVARLDALGPAKDIAQIGGAIGREFSLELLSGVAERQTEEAGLNKLVNAGLIFQRGTRSHATFLFKHALVQDAAYGTTLRAPRKRLHARIAEILTAQFPEILAQHYSKAGLQEKTATYWRAAGEQADSRSAFAEAIAHLMNALVVLAQLADDRTCGLRWPGS
jgi:predicted ATPase